MAYRIVTNYIGKIRLWIAKKYFYWNLTHLSLAKKIHQFVIRLKIRVSKNEDKEFLFRIKTTSHWFCWINSVVPYTRFIINQRFSRNVCQIVFSLFECLHSAYGSFGCGAYWKGSGKTGSIVCHLFGLYYIFLITQTLPNRQNYWQMIFSILWTINKFSSLRSQF